MDKKTIASFVLFLALGLSVWIINRDKFLAQEISIEQAKSVEFTFEDKSLKFNNGKYEDLANLTTATFFEENGGLQLAEIDEKPGKDAIVVYSVSTGGSGVFIVINVVSLAEDVPKVIAHKLLGDRIIIHNILVENKIISIDATVHGPDDAFCCPTLRKTINLKLENGILY